MVYLQTGTANYCKGNFIQAQQDLDASILIYKHLNNKKGLGNCYTTYGRMYNLLANYKLALTYSNLALDISKQLKNELGYFCLL